MLTYYGFTVGIGLSDIGFIETAALFNKFVDRMRKVMFLGLIVQCILLFKGGKLT